MNLTLPIVCVSNVGVQTTWITACGNVPICENKNINTRNMCLSIVAGRDNSDICQIFGLKNKR